jgi:hypothetical protein
MKKALIQGHEYAEQFTMPAAQLEKFARFLEVHPGFYPELEGQNAAISGFRVGGCFLSVSEMDELISTQSHAVPYEAAPGAPHIRGSCLSAGSKLSAIVKNGCGHCEETYPTQPKEG